MSKIQIPWLLVVTILFGTTLCAQDISGTWQGTLKDPEQDLRIVVQITKGNSGDWKAALYSIDQSPDAIPASSVNLEGSDFKLAVDGLRATYEGKVSTDGASIKGTWKQSQPLPLELVHVTKETAWPLDPSPHMPESEIRQTHQSAPSSPSVSLFDYDSKVPLDVQQKSVVVRDGTLVHDITYASPKGGRVPAFLVEPMSKELARGDHAGVVFLPSTRGGGRSSFLAEGILLAQVGAVSVMIDPPSLRPEPWRSRGGFDIPQIERNGHVQAVVDVRRAVDLLVSRPDVDPTRLAYIGHSYGASLGGAIAASEKRFKTLILMAGFASWTELYKTDTSAGAPTYSSGAPVPEAVLEKWLNTIRPLDALNYIGQVAPKPLLFQFAREDPYVTADQANEYFNAASSPKTIRWYDGGHEFNDVAALIDRAEWLRTEVGIKDMRPILEKKIEGHAGPR